jgi:hypothetical protein
VPPPQSNGNLVTIAPAAGAAVDDWDVPTPADGDGDKWTGSIRVYYREKVDRVQAGDELNLLTRRTAWASTAELPAELDTDDVVTLELDDGRTITGTARTIARSSLAGAGPVSTTRVDLEDG